MIERIFLNLLKGLELLKGVWEGYPYKC